MAFAAALSAFSVSAGYARLVTISCFVAILATISARIVVLPRHRAITESVIIALAI
jgi:hypothetical protein